MKISEYAPGTTCETRLPGNKKVCRCFASLSGNKKKDENL